MLEALAFCKTHERDFTKYVCMYVQKSLLESDDMIATFQLQSTTSATLANDTEAKCNNLIFGYIENVGCNPLLFTTYRFDFHPNQIEDLIKIVRMLSWEQKFDTTNMVYCCR
jgi:hypothetical protein